MLNLAGSNYHFGKCSVENGLVRQLLESSFEDTLSPPISWGFRILFYLCFLFLCHNISGPKSSEEHSSRPINVNKGNKKGGMHQCKCRNTSASTFFFPCLNCNVAAERVISL